ncbi:MAG: hypothetical protein JW779_01515 [Candidatus Thorarchaeota archaeon]|nr:hypothetical protein [Candidatus Thorarchaeota archaeon]
MKSNLSIILVLGIAMLMCAPSVQAIDLDPGGGGTEYYISIQATYIRLAQDSDLFSEGEIYMTNPGTDIWTVDKQKSWEDDTYLSGSTYYGKLYTVPYTVKYEKVISLSDIGTKFWFELVDDDLLWDASLWSGYIEIQSTGGLSGDWWSAAGRGVSRDLGPLLLKTSDSAHCIVGSDIQVYNQVAFHISFFLF